MLRLILILLLCLSPAWCAYSYKRTVTVDHTKVADALTDFPVLVSVTDATLKTVANGGHVQNASGHDIGFFSDSALTTPLLWEVEYYDGATGTLIAWVKIPALSDSVDTVIYLAYGDASISTFQSTASSVWSNGFQGVYHLADGTTLTVADSTTNANGTNTGVTATTGQVDGAGAFDGSSYVATDQKATSALTLSAWIKVGTISTRRDIYTIDDFTEGQWWFATRRTSDGDATFSLGSNATSYQHATSVGSVIAADTWQYVVGTWDKSSESGIIRLYIDGAEPSYAAQQTRTTDLPAVTVTSSYIGRKVRSGNQWLGALDEVRIATLKRSTGWVTTEYANQSAPGSFLTLGSETPLSVSRRIYVIN